MTLQIDFVENVSGTTLTLTLSVASTYTGGTVAAMDVSFDFDPAQGSYVSYANATGYSTTPNPTSTNVALSGFATDLVGGGPGTPIGTITFTLLNGATVMDFTNISGQVVEGNGDPFGPGFESHPDVPCFAAGTLIRTRRGDVPVEALQEGDEVATPVTGGWSKLVWIGHRDTNCARHPRPHDVMPVRVSRDAFGPGLPQRDLVLSPDHALYVDGVLIPVRYLLNGATIVQENAARMRYFHVELERHAVLLAEGLPAESYLDTGNRSAFANGGGGVMAHADFARGVWEAESCAPLVHAGPALAAVRAMLLGRATALGHRTANDCNLELQADGLPIVPISATATTLRFRLPAGTETLRLLSPSAVPGQIAITSDDHRRLGVAVGRLALDGTSLALDDARLSAGWHQPEAGWRWTNGAAELRPQGAVLLEVQVDLVTSYWQPSEAKAAEIAA